MHHTARRLTCSPNEATLLARVLGAPVLVGLPDPYVGWPTEEVEEVWERARQTLLARRYLQPGPEGTLLLPDDVTQLMTAWAWPQVSCIVTVSAGDGAPRRHYFHLGPQLVVEQTMPHTEAVEIQALDGPGAAWQRVSDLFGLVDQAAGPGPLLFMPRPQYDQHRQQARAAPARQGMLITLARHPRAWGVDGLGVLLGAEGAWRLRVLPHAGEEWVEILPAPAADLRRQVEQLIRQALAAARDPGRGVGLWSV